MATTSPNNISYPTNASAKKTIEGHLQDTATSVQTALNIKANLSGAAFSGNLEVSSSGTLINGSNGTATFTSNSSGKVPIVAKGASGQIANLQEWQDSTGAVLARVDSSSRFFAPNQPRFKAILGTSQSYGASAGALTVAFNNVLYNIGNGYNSSTGNFTAPVSGYYLVSAGFMSSASQSGFMVIETSYNNAITYGAQCVATSASVSSTEGGVSGSSVMYLNANDYIQLRGYKSVGGLLGNGGGASDWGEARNYFEAHLIA